MRQHSTALIDSSAEIAEDVEIGPYCVIGSNVNIDSGTKIHSHVVIKGITNIGKDNEIFQFTSIGEDCQDKKYAGEPTELIIGDRNCIREYATLHRGTAQDRGKTQIGDDNLLMAYTHVAHDCLLGNKVILSNAASMAGHVTLEDNVIVSGFALIHQFCTIGAHSFIGMGAQVTKDIAPFLMVSGTPGVTKGLNTEGLKRRGFTGDNIQNLKAAYRLLHNKSLLLEQAIEQIRILADSDTCVQRFHSFLTSTERRRSVLR